MLQEMASETRPEAALAEVAIHRVVDVPLVFGQLLGASCLVLALDACLLVDHPTHQRITEMPCLVSLLVRLIPVCLPAFATSVRLVFAVVTDHVFVVGALVLECFVANGASEVPCRLLVFVAVVQFGVSLQGLFTFELFLADVAGPFIAVVVTSVGVQLLSGFKLQVALGTAEFGTLLTSVAMDVERQVPVVNLSRKISKPLNSESFTMRFHCKVTNYSLSRSKAL